MTADAAYQSPRGSYLNPCTQVASLAVRARPKLKQGLTVSRQSFAQPLREYGFATRS